VPPGVPHVQQPERHYGQVPERQHAGWLGEAPSPTPLPSPVSVANARDRDCDDFKNQRRAQRFFKRHHPRRDPHNLDADNDGIACESNPCPCKKKPAFRRGEPVALSRTSCDRDQPRRREARLLQKQDEVPNGQDVRTKARPEREELTAEELLMQHGGRLAERRLLRAQGQPESILRLASAGLNGSLVAPDWVESTSSGNSRGRDRAAGRCRGRRRIFLGDSSGADLDAARQAGAELVSITREVSGQ
jgi:Excalibur calcium-binding domain